MEAMSALCACYKAGNAFSFGNTSSVFITHTSVWTKGNSELWEIKYSCYCSTVLVYRPCHWEKLNSRSKLSFWCWLKQINLIAFPPCFFFSLCFLLVGLYNLHLRETKALLYWIFYRESCGLFISERMFSHCLWRCSTDAQPVWWLSAKSDTHPC